MYRMSQPRIQILSEIDVYSYAGGALHNWRSVSSFYFLDVDTLTSYGVECLLRLRVCHWCSVKELYWLVANVFGHKQLYTQFKSPDPAQLPSAFSASSAVNIFAMIHLIRNKLKNLSFVIIYLLTEHQ